MWIIDRLQEIIPTLLYRVPAVILAFSLHEFCHAYASYRLGDPTAKTLGRLTLNPIRHIDPLGLITLILLGFGWGRPVPINPMFYQKPRRDIALVSLAGPFSNFVFGFVSMFFLGFFATFSASWAIHFTIFFGQLTLINFGLCIFNLIPIPPLDGSKILSSFLPDNARLAFLNLERYAFIFFIIIISTNIVDGIMTTGMNYLYHIAEISTGWLGNFLGSLF